MHDFLTVGREQEHVAVHMFASLMTYDRRKVQLSTRKAFGLVAQKAHLVSAQMDWKRDSC